MSKYEITMAMTIVAALLSGIAWLGSQRPAEAQATLEVAVEECESVYDSVLPVRFCQGMINIGQAQQGVPNEIINDPLVQYQIFQMCQEQWADFLSNVYLEAMRVEE